MYRRSGKAAKKASGVAWKDVPKKDQTQQVKTETKQFGKKGETRVVPASRETRYYPEYDVRRPLKSRKSHHKPTRLRETITPGTVLIILAGRFRGKRVIFLKQLPSGLLLVTGPYKVNGVPVRRVNQAYVIATATKVDISGLKVPKKFNDDYFRRPRKVKKAPTEKEFFADADKAAAAKDKKKKEKKELPEQYKTDVKEFDKAVLALVRQVPTLVAYLGAKFSLTKGQYPHDMKF
jgi:large subunit ribosomal protein L6e